MDGCSIHWIQFSERCLDGASRTILAASTEHFCARRVEAEDDRAAGLEGDQDLKMAVEVGLVTGVTPATTPTGSGDPRRCP